MTPDWFSGTYKCYKADTNAFVSWLTTAAIECGYDLNNPPNPHSSKPAGTAKKEKSKARSVVKVSGRQLLEQAKHVVGSGSRVPVPSEVVNAAKRTVEARRKCAAWYAATFAGIKSATLDAQNRGHRHFVTTLLKILDILEPNFMAAGEEKQDGEEVADGRKWADVKNLTNIFELLDVEDCIDDDGDTPLSANSTPVPKSKAKMAIAGQKDGEGIESRWYFKAFCAFQDLNDIRGYLKGLWEGYRGGKVDIIVAAATTEVAFHIMEELERDTLCPMIGGRRLDPEEVAGQFFEHCCHLRGEIPIVGPGPMWDVAEWLGLTIKPQLDLWIGEILHEKAELRRCYGVYDPSADRNKMSSYQRYCEDCFILAHIISDTVVSGNCQAWGYNLLTADKVTETLRDLGHRHEKSMSSIWLCFGIQILLDTHYPPDQGRSPMQTDAHRSQAL